MPAVAEGRFDLGLVIHESRFTYPNHGLTCIRDLGEHWEERTGLPIPLGGIAVRRALPDDVRESVARTIRESLRYAQTRPDDVWPYILRHAGELDDDVIRRHIGLYVNDFTTELGDEGRTAIERLRRVRA
jgi:1,4-dihydroxy-6-naphthoate synthase